MHANTLMINEQHNTHGHLINYRLVVYSQVKFIEASQQALSGRAVLRFFC